MSHDTSTKKLFCNSALYIVSGILAKGIHFFLLPVYTIYLTTEDYGIQNLILSFNSVITYVVLLCLDSALLKYYNEFKDQKEILKRIYGTAISIVAIFSIISFGLLFLLRNVLSDTVLKGIDFFPYIVLGFFILMFDAFFSLHKRMLEAQQNGKKVTAVSIVQIFFSTGMTLILVVYMKKGALGLLIAGAIASMGTVIFMIVDILKFNMVTMCLDFNLAKVMFKYSIPLIPHHASGYIATLISKVFLNNSASLATVGLYGIASQFSNIIDTFQDSASHAYRPWIFGKLENKRTINKHEIRNNTLLLISLFTLAYGAVGLFAPEIIYMMTSKAYHEAWKVIPILVIYYSLKSIYYFYVDQCLYYNNTANKVFVASITGSLCNIIAAYLFVPIYGMYGTAIAMIISVIVLITIVVFIVKKWATDDIGYSIRLFIFRISIAWVFIAVGILPNYIYDFEKPVLLNICYKLLVSVIYCFLLWTINRRAIANISGGKGLAGIIRSFISKK